jgi:hypothetical protein
MSRFRLFAFITLITLAFGVALVGNALAGEKFKTRGVGYITKWEPVNVGDEEGHVVAVFDAKGIMTNLQGKSFLEGWPWAEQGLVDLNTKTKTLTNQGYDQSADKEGNKIYVVWQGKGEPGGIVRGTMTITKGTGKYEGIRGNGAFVSHLLGGGQWYADGEWDVEMPR